MTQDPVPQRLSDAERDAAAAMLREHFEAGRLDAGEFDERLGTALAARYASDLTALFSDLPEPRPAPEAESPAATRWSSPTPWSSTTAPVPATRPGARVPSKPGGTDWVGVARGAIWPVAILLGLLTGNWWTFIVIAIIGSVVLGQIAGNQRKPPPHLDK